MRQRLGQAERLHIVHVVPPRGPDTISLRAAVEALVLRQIARGLGAERIEWPDPAGHEAPSSTQEADILHVHATNILAAMSDPPIGLGRRGFLTARHRQMHVLSVHGPACGSAPVATRRGRRALRRYAYLGAAEASWLTPAALAPRPGMAGVVADADAYAPLYDRLCGITKRRILATSLDVLTKQAAMTAIQSTLATGDSRRVAFVNAHLAIEAARDPAVARALAAFTLLNDGIGIDLASTLLYGRRFPDNLNGTDFTPALLDASRPGLRLYLLGASAEVIAAASTVYAARWPQHRVVGCHDGFFDAAEGILIADRIRDARCDIVLVGMGCPRQELWIAEHIPAVAPIGIGVGALFDFQTGRVARASRLVRRLRLEWVWRLALEPHRLWRRYVLGGTWFLGGIVRQWRRGERA